MATKKDLFLPVFLLRQNLCTLCVPGVYLLGWDCDTCESVGASSPVRESAGSLPSEGESEIFK